jgi:serine protease AprX
MTELIPCPSCHRLTPPAFLLEAHDYAFWRRPDGACPACVQQTLLETLLGQGDEALHDQIQSVWPLDAAAAFGALPTPLRLHADPRFTGRGVTLAILDSGFYPHPDLTLPHNRIRAWVNATTASPAVIQYQRDECPRWPSWSTGADNLWHGTMTAVTAAGNGFLSHGFYRGLASDADLVLIQVQDEQGIRDPAILRALDWVIDHQDEFDIRLVNMSFGGDPAADLAYSPVDMAVADLVRRNIIVTVAAGNDGRRRLVPPATAPEALTIGGLDDHNTFDHDDIALWHSNYGQGAGCSSKPDLVAPSIWLAAPLLPCSPIDREAAVLFRKRGQPAAEARIAELKLITAHYQHVDGTSFAAPLVAGAVACLLEANPGLSPADVRRILRQTALPIPGVSRERQGAGALVAGAAVTQALRERLPDQGSFLARPASGNGQITFTFVDPKARRVQLMGSWDDWRAPGLEMAQLEAGVWRADRPPLPNGLYNYKFLVDGRRWLDDPANPRKAWDGYGGFNSVLVLTDRPNERL